MPSASIDIILAKSINLFKGMRRTIVKPTVVKYMSSLGVESLDQFASSASNGLFGILAVRLLTLTQLATFGIASTLIIVSTSFTRSIIGHPYFVTSRAQSSIEANCVAWLYLIVILPLSTFVGFASAFAIGDLSAESILVICFSTLLILSQDSLRYICLSEKKATLALRADISWIFLLLIAVVVLPPHGPFALIVFWSAASLPGSVYIIAILNIRPVRTKLNHWFSEQRSLLLTATLTTAASIATAVAAQLIVRNRASLMELGRIRVWAPLMSVQSTLVQALSLPAVGLFVRFESVRRRRAMASLMFGLAAAFSVVGVAIVAIVSSSNEIAERAFGKNWASAQTLSKKVAIALALVGLNAAINTVLRARLAGSMLAVAMSWAATAVSLGLVWRWSPTGADGYFSAVVASQVFLVPLGLLSVYVSVWKHESKHGNQFSKRTRVQRTQSTDIQDLK